VKRILHREKPKAHILENMTRTVFKETKSDAVIVEMKPDVQSRSTKQNALYWKWLGVLTETGNSQGALHQYLAQEFLSPVAEDIQGQTVLVIKSTTTLTVKEFAEYLEHVQQFADSLGCILPRPEELYLESMMK
tara:strand:+ start:97 stop:498 length:402 start_codon:yes stop_codon:yes gene_type:complete